MNGLEKEVILREWPFVQHEQDLDKSQSRLKDFVELLRM